VYTLSDEVDVNKAVLLLCIMHLRTHIVAGANLKVAIRLPCCYLISSSITFDSFGNFRITIFTLLSQVTFGVLNSNYP
jgi:hypothetical protein